MIRELDTVVLSRDLAEYGLSKGDIGVVVHIHDSGRAYEVEFVTGEGKTIAVLTLEADDVRPMAENEILHARRIHAA